MALLTTVALMLAPTPAPALQPDPRRPCAPCSYSAAHHRRAHRALAAARWYLRRHHATKPYRAWLASTRACEVRGQPDPYRTSTGNGFHGAYQVTLSSWRGVGGRGLPEQAPPLEQDYRAVLILHQQGRGAWPVCG